MKYIWLLPADFAPSVATLLIIFCGFAVMARQKALAISLFASAVLLLCAPLFDPVVDAAVDTAIDTGEHYIKEWPWWLITAVFLITLLLLLRTVIAFIFNKNVADNAMGTLISDSIRFVLRVVILGPFRLIAAIFRFLIR